ncbi:glutamate racemase [Owenweeksia hongkongensis]|uniref:glutamate racemase n=1 Tax=Owenweeksia hongkongensis TaxID=253245 RepID=UPI003A8F85F3
MNRPIGIFDSGVGGLTVAAAIRKFLPNESFVYFGDTKHSPYGDKSDETIRNYSEEITRFLISQDCKAIVIACNTASALAYNYLVKNHPDIPIINVVDPVVAHVGSKINNKVGIIATRATTKSDIYRKKLRRLNPKLHVAAAATPLLVTIVEEGFVNTKVSAGAIEAYLGVKKFSDVTTVILGCTHFPLLQKEIESFFGGRAEVVDSPELVAHHLKLQLQKAGLLSQETEANYHFYVSEKTDAFARTAKMFFGADIKLEEKTLRVNGF